MARLSSRSPRSTWPAELGLVARSRIHREGSSGVGFRVKGLGYRVWGLGVRVADLGFGV